MVLFLTMVYAAALLGALVGFARSVRRGSGLPGWLGVIAAGALLARAGAVYAVGRTSPYASLVIDTLAALALVALIGLLVVVPARRSRR